MQGVYTSVCVLCTQLMQYIYCIIPMWLCSTYVQLLLARGQTSYSFWKNEHEIWKRQTFRSIWLVARINLWWQKFEYNLERTVDYFQGGWLHERGVCFFFKWVHSWMLPALCWCSRGIILCVCACMSVEGGGRRGSLQISHWQSITGNCNAQQHHKFDYITLRCEPVSHFQAP